MIWIKTKKLLKRKLILVSIYFHYAFIRGWFIENSNDATHSPVGTVDTNKVVLWRNWWQFTSIIGAQFCFLALFLAFISAPVHVKGHERSKYATTEASLPQKNTAEVAEAPHQ